MEPETPADGQCIDVCNGDADGLCAVLQWRLHHPAPATLVTGLKREIGLLERVHAAPGDNVLVCDISMARNRPALLRLLAQGVHVRYFDHHAVVDVPVHQHLESHIELGAGVCTSLLMDRHLGGAFRTWALVGAYGDNLGETADALGRGAGLGREQQARLRLLGEAINYNAYGEDEADLHITPARLYAIMACYRDPFDLLAREPVAAELDALRRADLEHALAMPPYWQDDRVSVHLLPDAPWSRRVSGSLANQLARLRPAHAHAVLKPLRGGGFLVSVRAPRAAAGGANELCSRFGGAGRAVAAGIDRLPSQELEHFIKEFAVARWEAR